MKKLLALAAIVALAGCASIESPLDDGYQFGDLTKTPFELQRQYCETADPKARAIRMALLQRFGVHVPSDGACTSILEYINDS